MSLSPNEKALVDKSLGKIEETLNSLLYISNDDIDKSEIIQHLWRVLMGEEPPKACGKCEYCRQGKQLAVFTEVSSIEIS